mgnify:CR=1 FL=1
MSSINRRDFLKQGVIAMEGLNEFERAVLNKLLAGKT